MSETSKNPMSEDELLSALGFSVAEPKPRRDKPAVIDGDILIDILAPESKPARKARASSERERAREEQEREKSLRSKEWKRELEQQKMRAAALAASEENAPEEKPAPRRSRSFPTRTTCATSATRPLPSRRSAVPRTRSNAAASPCRSRSGAARKR